MNAFTKEMKNNNKKNVYIYYYYYKGVTPAGITQRYYIGVRRRGKTEKHEEVGVKRKCWF